LSTVLNDIKAILKDDLKRFEEVFSQSVKTKVSLLDTILNYIVKRKGKQVRPMFVMLTAGCYGPISEKTFRGASLVELLHTATLVHDDVVDESYKRRGFFSINALWKNKIAVLVGDFLLSRGLILSIDNKDFDMLEIVSVAVKRMSEGELLQLEKARKLDITEEAYFDIIGKKTASLFAACCAIGAASANQSPDVIQNMKDFGEYAGIAFQIKDDLFDFDQAAKSGKPKGVDIKERKMTLPLIYALQNADASQKKHIIRIFKKNPDNSEKVKEIMAFITNSGGPDYALKQMIAYRDKAMNCLVNVPDNPYKAHLVALLDFIINRNN
jgi:octaprenyl-diphosphate synthase